MDFYWVLSQYTVFLVLAFHEALAKSALASQDIAGCIRRQSHSRILAGLKCDIMGGFSHPGSSLVWTKSIN
jgi:hypothetical protein